MHRPSFASRGAIAVAIIAGLLAAACSSGSGGSAAPAGTSAEIAQKVFDEAKVEAYRSAAALIEMLDPRDGMALNIRAVLHEMGED